MAGPLDRIGRREHNAVVPAPGRNAGNGQPRIRFTSVDNRPYEFTEGLKTVGDLWQEYMHGINGRMPVSQFEAKHTGSRAHKNRYYQRKPIYELVSSLVRAGRAPCEAIGLVEAAYPGVKVTALGKKIRHDTRNRTLPRPLRI
jgi:Transcriptional activator of glycolytic enzymes